MEIFDLAIPDCPPRTSVQKLLTVNKPILQHRLVTVEEYYKTFMDAPEANLAEWKHALRVLKYMIEDMADHPESFTASEAIVIPEMLKNLAAIMVIGQTPQEFRKGLDILRQIRHLLTPIQ